VIQLQLPTHGFPLAAAVGSPDEQWVATSDMMGRAWIWELRACTPRPIDFPRGAALLEFTPDSHALVLRHPDNSLHFLNATNGADEKSLAAPAKPSLIRFNRSGELLLALGGGQLNLLRAADGQRVRLLDLPTEVTTAVWHPDGRRFALAWMSRIGLWDAETGRQLGVFEGNEGLVVGLAFTDTGEWLASASWDHTTRLWQTDTAREALRLTGSGNTLRFSADGRHLSFKSWDNARVHLYEFADTHAVQRFTIPAPARLFNRFTSQAVFSDDGELVAALDREGIYIFHPPHPAPAAILPGAGNYAVQFQPNGHALLACARDGVKRWPIEWSADHAELRIGPPEILEPTRGQRIDAFEVSRDGHWLLASTKKTFLAFNPDQTAEAIRTGPPIEPGHTPHLSPDGRIAASVAGSPRARVQIWSPRTGDLVTNLAVRTARDLAFSPDGRWLACAAEDATTIWQTADWSQRHRIPHPPETPGRYHVAFSPDGRVVAITVSEQATRLVLLETGEELGTLPTDRMLNSLAFSPAGDRLAAACEPGYFQLWDLHHLREQLAGMRLDWPGPPLSPRHAAGKPARVTVVPRVTSAPRPVPETAAGR
jgi:WD40 repeat protein